MTALPAGPEHGPRRGMSQVIHVAAVAGPVPSLSSPGGTVALALLALCGLIVNFH